MRTRARVAMILVAVALLATVGADARADEPATDRASAELLFDQGRKLLDEGKLDEACAKLEASERAEAAVGTLLNLGECNERRGRTATAWSNYRAAASLAETRSDAKRADVARRRAAKLEAHLPTITIHPLAREPGLVVKRDGAQIDEGGWETPLPVDPGSHVIEASARGKIAWSTKVTVASDSGAVVVEVPRLDAAPETDAQPPTTTPGPAPAAPGRDEGRGGTRRALRAAGIAAGGIGIVGLGLGTYFALHARSLWSDAGPHCDASNVCDDTGFSLNQDARRSGDAATIAIATGAVLLAVGVALWLFAPDDAVRP